MFPKRRSSLTNSFLSCMGVTPLKVDDKESNCKAVEGMNEGVETLHVAVEGGMSDWECNAIRAWALEGVYSAAS